MSASYTEQRSPDTLDYSSADYTVVYDYLLERICETGETEDKVCCSKDDTEVGKFSTFIYKYFVSHLASILRQEYNT